MKSLLDRTKRRKRKKEKGRSAAQPTAVEWGSERRRRKSARLVGGGV